MRGGHAEEESDLLYEDNVHAKNMLHLRDSKGNHVARWHGHHSRRLTMQSGNGRALRGVFIADTGQFITPELMMLITALIVACPKRLASYTALSSCLTSLTEYQRMFSAIVATKARLRV